MGHIDFLYATLVAISASIAILLGLFSLRAMLTRVDRGPALKAVTEIAAAFKTASEAKSGQIMDLEKVIQERDARIARILADHQSQVDTNTQEIARLNRELGDLAALYARSQLLLSQQIATLTPETPPPGPARPAPLPIRKPRARRAAPGGTP